MQDTAAGIRSNIKIASHPLNVALLSLLIVDNDEEKTMYKLQRGMICDNDPWPKAKLGLWPGCADLIPEPSR